jgi:hypothetical protein
MIFYLVCFLGFFYDNMCDLFWCHHITFHNGFRTISLSSFSWWGGVLGGATVSFQWDILFSPPEYDINNSFF